MRHMLMVGAMALGLWIVLGCHADQPAPRDSVAAYQERMLADYQAEQAAAPAATPAEVERHAPARPAPPLAQPADESTGPAREALLAQPIPDSRQPGPDQLLREFPDPIDAPAVYRARADELAAQSPEPRIARRYRTTVDTAIRYLEDLARPQRVELSLPDAIRRALAHNYSIRVQSYNPAIEAARLVEAEAAFDAEFFLDSSYSRRDAANIVPSIGDQTDSRALRGGLRKLLPTGMVASVGPGITRNQILSPDVPKGTNPSWATNFVAELRQPLLRNFGLAVNRAQIEIARANRAVSYWRFVREVRDRLRDVEVAYWRLVQTRRNVAVLAESVAQNYATYLDLHERRFHDATPVQIANAQARWQGRYVELLEAIKNVRDAEDALKNLINDPALKLSTDIEIIPTETPLAVPITLDQFAEVRRALESRPEIREAKLGIDALRVGTTVARNQTLPQLDLAFQYEVQGAGTNADAAFDNLTTNRFISYGVTLSLVYPIGNRRAEAGLRRARLQEEQAVVALHQILDAVVQEVNAAVRVLLVRYSQIPPQYEAVQSSDRNLRAL